jgi:hypothetical protein
MRISALAALSLVFVLVFCGSALAEVESEVEVESNSDDEAAGAAATPQPKPPVARGLTPFDALGRPFPDPALLRMARGWTVGGAVLTVSGASMMLTGMLLGSAAARGQLVLPDGAQYGFFVLLAGGPGLLFAGLPLMASGTFTTGQLLRTIKGVPKVPRTVANERRYWQGYQLGLYGQAVVIAGGATVLMGVLGLVAASFAVGSEYYNPAVWAIPIGSFASSAGLIVLGLLMQRASKAKMEKIRDAVDPFRQDPATSKTSAAPAGISPGALALLPMPSFSVAADARGRSEARASLRWSFSF